MPRLPLATDLKTRTGAPDKDARLKNAYVETRGDQSVVRKRPIAQGGISIATVGSIAQGGYGDVIFYSDTPYVISSSTSTTWSPTTPYVVGDKVTKNFVDYWADADNTNSEPPSADWSSSYVPSVPSSPPVGLGDVSIFFTSTGFVTAQNAAGQFGQMQLTGFSNFGNPIQFGGTSNSAMRIAFTATRNLDLAKVVLIISPTNFSFVVSGLGNLSDLSTIIELNSTNFPLIGSTYYVASDIGAFSALAGYGSFTFPELVIYGNHPSDGTVRFYAANRNGVFAYVTDSITINTWLEQVPRMNNVYTAIYIDTVNRSSAMNNVIGYDPSTGAAIITKSNVAYDSVNAEWIALDKYGNMGGGIPITGTDWVVYLKGSFAYFIGTAIGTVYVVDFAKYDGAAGDLVTLDVVTAISGGGAYLDSRIDFSGNIYVSYSIAGDNYINSDGTITPAAGIPKLTFGDISRRKYSIKGTV